MGHLSALGMVEHGGIDVALPWHLAYNHYPPLPACLEATARGAIQAAQDEDWDREIPLPNGVAWRGATSMTAAHAVEAMHLDAFLAMETE